MMGPLEAWHDMRLYRSWIQTGQVDPQVLQQTDPDYILAVREKSLASLCKMEADCDVIISDVIQKHLHDQRLFFTFNHPTRFVLTPMTRRLLERRNLATRAPEITEDIEPLGRYCVPSLWPGSQARFRAILSHWSQENLQSASQASLCSIHRRRFARCFSSSMTPTPVLPTWPGYGSRPILRWMLLSGRRLPETVRAKSARPLRILRVVDQRAKSAHRECRRSARDPPERRTGRRHPHAAAGRAPVLAISTCGIGPALA